MPLEDEVYIFGTTKGDAIPFNIARPKGCIIHNFTDVVSGPFVLPDISLPYVLLADVDCLVGFNVIPDRNSVIHQPSVVFVPAGKEVAVAPLNDSVKVQALRAGESGKLIVQSFELYKAIGREVLQEQTG